MLDALGRGGADNYAVALGPGSLQEARQGAFERRRQEVIEADLGHDGLTVGASGGSAFLVMLGDEAVEQADAERGGALRHGRRVLFRPGDAGDVEMRPWHVVDEALEELRADRATRAAIAGDVLDIGGIAVDRAVVAVAHRQPP